MTADILPGFGPWWAAVLMMMVFGAFVLFVPFYRRGDRKAAAAYLVYSAVFSLCAPGDPGTPGHYLFLVSILAGGILIVGGWARISRDYWSAEEEAGRLVMEGLYRHIRHPQYAGFIFITTGMAIERFSLPLALLWPFPALLYHRLARSEEALLEEAFGPQWREYRAKTGMYLPRLAVKRRS